MKATTTADNVRSADASGAAQDSLPQPLALLLFTQRLAGLMEAHIGPVSAFAILEDSPAPYGEAAGRLRAAIEEGDAACRSISQQERDSNRDTWWHPLSIFQALSGNPEQFSTVYITVVRAGEMAGTVDEVLRRLQSALAREWRLLAREPASTSRMLLSRPASMPGPKDWHELSPYQQMATLTLFFETFSLLLTSGWALLPAMETVSALLPSAQAAEFLAIRHEIEQGAPLPPLPIGRMSYIPRYALEIAAAGMANGQIETALHEIALLLEQEMEYRLMGAGLKE